MQSLALGVSGDHLVSELRVLLETIEGLSLLLSLQVFLALLLPLHLVDEVVLVLVLHASAPHLVEALDSQVLTRDLC